MSKRKEKLLLIDANGLAYRAFYAVKPMITTTGIPVHAIAGFADMVEKIIRMEKPTHIVAAFDKGLPTEKMDHYQDYNALRLELPPELALQLPYIHDLLRSMDIPVVRRAGFEADDCIGTLTKEALEEEFEVRILSGDLSLLQLVKPHVKVLTTRRGMSDLVMYDEREVKRRFNLKPEQLADLRALAGDSSENIQGVPGIGEVTAKKLLSQHGSLKRLLRSLQKLPSKWRVPLKEYSKQVMKFRERAVIKSDLDIKMDWSRAKFKGIPLAKVDELLSRIELSGVIEGLVSDSKKKLTVPREISIYKTKRQMKTLTNFLAGVEKQVYFLLLGDQAGVCGIFLARGDDKKALVLFDKHPEGELKFKDVYEVLKPYLDNSDLMKISHNLRALLMCAEDPELKLDKSYFDIGLAYYLVNGRSGNPWLDEIAAGNGLDIPGEGSLLGHGKGHREFVEVDSSELARWGYARLKALPELYEHYEQQLVENNLLEHYYRVEFQCLEIFSSLEKNAFFLDADKLSVFSKSLGDALENCRSEIYRLGEREFDIDDNKMLSEVLFDNLGLTLSARPKNGMPINFDLIVEASELHPIGSELLLYRALTSLVEVYSIAERIFIGPRYGWFERRRQFMNDPSDWSYWFGPTLFGGAISFYNRMICSIQTLPDLDLREALSKELKDCLIAAEGKQLLALQYDQFAIRMAAELSGDKKLQNSFADKKKNVARELGLLLQEVEVENAPELSKRELIDIVLGKLCFDSLARRYGLSIEVSKTVVKAILDKAQEEYPELFDYYDNEIDKVEEFGKTTTHSGRLVVVPEVRARNSDIAETASRLVKHAKIQGSCIDVVKLCFDKIVEQLTGKTYDQWSLLGVIDGAIVFEAPQSIKKADENRLKTILVKVVDFDCPLPVEVFTGACWNDITENQSSKKTKA